MTRVNINGANHQVEVQHDSADLADVIEKAQKLWDDTSAGARDAGPAFGYSTQASLDTNRSVYGQASFKHGDRPVVEG